MQRIDASLSERQKRLRTLLSEDIGPKGIFGELFQRIQAREEKKVERDDDDYGRYCAEQRAYAYVRACEESLLTMLMQRKPLPHILGELQDVSEAQARAFAHAYHIEIDDAGRVTVPPFRAFLNHIQDLDRVNQDTVEQREQFQQRLRRYQENVEHAPRELTQLFRDLEVIALLQCPDEEY